MESSIYCVPLVLERLCCSPCFTGLFRVSLGSDVLQYYVDVVSAAAGDVIGQSNGDLHMGLGRASLVLLFFAVGNIF